MKHFGYEFRYDINDVDPDDPLPQEIPVECHQLLDRIIGQGLVQSRPDQLTVNQYEPGQGEDRIFMSLLTLAHLGVGQRVLLIGQFLCMCLSSQLFLGINSCWTELLRIL